MSGEVGLVGVERGPVLPEGPEVPLLRSDPLAPLLVPPGVSAPPVAELLPERPKNEKTL